MQLTANRYESRQNRSEETSFSCTIFHAPDQTLDTPEAQEEGSFILSQGKKAAPIGTSGWTNGINGSGELLGALTSTPASLPTHVERVPEQHLPQQRFLVLQKWEGTVVSVEETSQEFVAVLRDLTDTSRLDEEATFPLEEVPDSDRDLLAPGAVFYWNVGYELNLYGQRKRVSAIRFRRLPAWTRSEIESVRRTAERFRAIFGLNAQPQTVARS